MRVLYILREVSDQELSTVAVLSSTQAFDSLSALSTQTFREDATIATLSCTLDSTVVNEVN